MTETRLDRALQSELKILQDEGRAKPPERIITAYHPPENDLGPRYSLEGENRRFLRMSSNSYLSLSNHPLLIARSDHHMTKPIITANEIDK